MSEAAAGSGRGGNREFTLDTEFPYARGSPVRWLLSHVLRYPQLPLIMIGAAIANNTAFSVIQVLVGRGFDRIMTPGWLSSDLAALALAVMASALAQGVTGLLRNLSVEFLAQRTERDCRDELYVSLLGKSQTFHGRQRIGDIMARCTNDVRQLNYMFSPGIMLITDSTMAVVVPITIIGIMQARLLLVPLCFVALLALTVYDYNRRLEPVSNAQREQFAAMNATLADAVAGIEVVKSNTGEARDGRQFTEAARAFRNSYVRQGAIQAVYLPMLVFAGAWAAGFLHALFLWRAGVLSLGQVVAFMGLMGALRFPTFISIFSFNLVQLGLASARRILGLILTETDLDENRAGTSRPMRGEVVFESVGFGYDGAAILRDVSFTVQPGETVAIVGRTGSGKTTLTRLVNRIFDATEGRVLADGVDVRSWSLESLRSQISVIEQDVFLFSRSIAENISFGRPQASREEVEEAARQAQAHQFITRLEKGYDTVVGERGVTLSGGQRQRIAIARAFLTRPSILILDDSTSAIDSATEEEIQRAIRRVSRQQTTFLITHRLSQIRWADRILVLRQGRLADQGRHEELLARSADYRRIFAQYA